MKNFIITLIVLFASVFAVKAQPAVMGGLLLSKNASDVDNPSLFLPSYTGGFTFDIGDDTRHYAFRPGIAVCQKGWRLKGDVDETQLFRNLMLQFPFRWVHKIRLTDDLRLELGYGCFIEFALDGYVKIKYPSLTGEYVIDGKAQTVHYDAVTKDFPGKLYSWDHGSMLHIGMSTNRYYAGASMQVGVQQCMSAFLFTAGYYFSPCREKEQREKAKRDPNREYLWGN